MMWNGLGTSLKSTCKVADGIGEDNTKVASCIFLSTSLDAFS